jgi:pyruvate/2-oxoglutarate dehydrogenase complex dihydrolipoamide dehydrogenase (E3) component
LGREELKVKLNDGGEEKIRAKKIIIATGSDVSPSPVNHSRLMRK